MLSSYTDIRDRKIKNIHVLSGLLGLYIAAFLQSEEPWNILFATSVRFLAGCVCLYPMFAMSLLGAGDIKLISVLLAASGSEDGILIIFYGLLPASLIAIVRLVKENVFFARLYQLVSFLFQSLATHSMNPYRDDYSEKDLIPLAPFLLFGFCVFCILSTYG